MVVCFYLVANLITLSFPPLTLNKMYTLEHVKEKNELEKKHAHAINVIKEKNSKDWEVKLNEITKNAKLYEHKLNNEYSMKLKNSIISSKSSLKASNISKQAAVTELKQSFGMPFYTFRG